MLQGPRFPGPAAHASTLAGLKDRTIPTGIIWWTAAGILVAVLVGMQMVAPIDALSWLSALGLAHSALVFWEHGGSRVTAAGAFAVATGAFAYFPGLYLSFSPGRDDQPGRLLAAVCTVYFGQVITYYAAWARLRAPVVSPTQPGDPRVLRWTLWTGISMMAVGALGQQYLGMGSTTLAGAAAFTGANMAAFAVIQMGRRPALAALATIAATFGFYVAVMFTGGGRLVLGGLALALAMHLAARSRRRALKATALFALPAGIIYLAQVRAEMVAATRGASETGLESVLAPLRTFARLIMMADAGTLEMARGGTFFAALVVPVPRDLWAGKPPGLGVELAGVFRPELVRFGYSEAVLGHGEFFYNFGWPGVIVGIAVLAWFVAWLDRILARVHARPLATRRDALAQVAAVIAVAGLLDLVWTGTATYAGRAGQRLIVILLLLALFAWNPRTDRSTDALSQAPRVAWRAAPDAHRRRDIARA